MTSVADALATDWSPLESRVAADLGLRADDTARTRLIDAAQQRMRGLRIRSLTDYLQRLDGTDGRAELTALAQALTIGESYFLRGADHFAVFAEQVVPQRLRVNTQRPHLRVLSAGCSSGEEIYSLGIILADQFPQLAEADVELFGIDITDAALEKARSGVYTPWSMRDVPASVIERHFRLEKGRYTLSPSIRRRVRFERVNLLDPQAAFPPGPFDAIFCRNVLIYFTPEAMRQVVGRFESLLAVGGYLFLGHSESLRGLTRSFRTCQGHDSFYYQRLASPEVFSSLLDEEARRQYGWADAAQPLSLGTPPRGDGPNLNSFASSRLDRDLPRTRVFAPAARRVERPVDSLPHHDVFSAGEAPLSPYQAALEKWSSERYAEVVSLLGDSSELDALVLRAAALMQRGRFSEARASCERVRTDHPLNADVAHLLALCREQLADRSGAQEQAQLAVYLDAEFAAPQLLLARIARRGNDAGAARRALTRALQLLPHETPTRVRMFGGGFPVAVLAQVARAELAALGAPA